MQVTPNVSTGNGMDFLIGRVSYTFGLTGPCVSTHTACSSSLVSTHLAVHGLTAQDCSAAITAGVFLILLDGTMAGICQLQVSGPHLPLQRRTRNRATFCWRARSILLEPTCERYQCGRRNACRFWRSKQNVTCRHYRLWDGAKHLMHLEMGMVGVRDVQWWC